MSKMLRASAWLSALVVAGLIVMPLTAAEKKSKEAPETVELFQAMEDGKIEVKFIPKNAQEAQLIVKNVGKKPLTVKLPEVAAGVPVLKQAFGGGQQGGGAFGGGGANQGTGTGLGGGGGLGGGLQNIAPEKVVKLKVPCVCLDHGKPDPNPRVPYELRPLESYNSNPGVAEALTMLNQEGASQKVVQAAAWHLANGLTWEKIASLKIDHLRAPDEPLFTAKEIHAAVALAKKSKEQAASKTKSSPGESLTTTASN